MGKLTWASVSALFLLILGCGFLGNWKSIPPPGGCEQCHAKQISANWQVAYRPADINDEQDRNRWQRPQALSPVDPPAQLEQTKITEQQCFRCHKGPDRAHMEYKGRFHH